MSEITTNDLLPLIEYVKILISKESDKLKFDTTKRGIVRSFTTTECVVEMDGEEFTCKVLDGVGITVGDVVFVHIPHNDFSSKYVSGKIGVLGAGGNLINIDGGKPSSNYGGIDSLDAGRVS